MEENILYLTLILMLFPVKQAEESPAVTLVEHQPLTAGTQKHSLQKVTHD